MSASSRTPGGRHRTPRGSRERHPQTRRGCRASDIQRPARHRQAALRHLPRRSRPHPALSAHRDHRDRRETDLGSPILFRQRRPGLNGQPFTIYKFRSMRDATNKDGRLIEDAERTTRLGRRLRDTSLDELPELLNVLRGDMSLVGPRPLLMQYLDRYTPEQARRHEVPRGSPAWPRSAAATR